MQLFRLAIDFRNLKSRHNITDMHKLEQSIKTLGREIIIVYLLQSFTKENSKIFRKMLIFD